MPWLSENPWQIQFGASPHLPPTIRSSLYPCYFTIETDRDTIFAKDKYFILQVSNVGTESDSYKITISSSANHYSIYLNSGVINKQKNTVFKILPSSNPSAR